MSSRRRSRSRSRDKKNAAAKLRMDTKPQTLRITDPTNPAGRRKEIDNVMKKARAQRSPTSDAIWNKRLLEVEAKDPNRWTHSGYKSLYIDGNTSPSPNRRSRSRSFNGRAARSPDSPPSRRRSPMGGRRSPVRARSPPPRRTNNRSPTSSYNRSPARARSPPARGRPRSPPPRRMPSPSPARRRSPSGSSVSSCSDESCSVCSPKTRRPRSRSFSPPPRTSAGSSRKHVKRPPSPKVPARRRPPSPSPSPPPRRMPRPMTPPVAKKMPRMSSSDKPTDPRRQPPPPRPRGSTGEVISIKGLKPSQKPAGPSKTVKIKQEGSRQKPTTVEHAEVGDSSGSEEPPPPVVVPIVATTGIMLSERFGKIAQWSADRERRDMENMRITKTGSNMKVMVEEEDYLYGTPPRRYSLSPGPAGRFPEELLASGPSSLASWDDVRVRYQYYKDLGYLRDLSIDDYMKWEEWWYKYQDWLANERHYEHWLTNQGSGGGGGRRRRKKPIQSRLN